MASNKSKTNGATEPQVETATVTTIKYEVARDECKEMHERAERDHWRLGEIAHHVETKYGDRTLARLSEDSGFADCTLERHRSVYRAWMEKPAPGPVSYSVLRALQEHPDRYNIVTENPTLTQGKAQEIMRQYRKENPSTATSIEADQTEDDDLLEEAEQQDTAPPAKGVTTAKAKKPLDEETAEFNETKLSFSKDVALANKIIEAAEVRKTTYTPKKLRHLVKAVAAFPASLDTMRRAGESWLEYVDWLDEVARDAATGGEDRIRTSPKPANDQPSA